MNIVKYLICSKESIFVKPQMIYNGYITIREYLKDASKPVIKGKFMALNAHFFKKKKELKLII